MTDTISDILKRNQLSVTDSRKKILELFREANSALSHADVEKRAGELFDRVTVYRTLQAFVEKGMIHTIPTADNSIKYALCKNHCTQGHHHDNHVHFVCDNCGAAYCLDEIKLPEIKLPENFTQNRTDIIVSGFCKDCTMNDELGMRNEE